MARRVTVAFAIALMNVSFAPAWACCDGSHDVVWDEMRGMGKQSCHRANPASTLKTVVVLEERFHYQITCVLPGGKELSFPATGVDETLDRVQLTDVVRPPVVRSTEDPHEVSVQKKLCAQIDVRAQPADRVARDHESIIDCAFFDSARDRTYHFNLHVVRVANDESTK